jgi:hypothetical protein
MAATNYAKSQGRQHSRPGVLPRAEWYGRANETAARGTALPQSKLDEEKVAAIRSAARQRANLRKYITENLTNDALAAEFGVHPRVVEKVLSGETWSHVA